MVERLCFVVNPLAGIGGRLGFKGSDGEAGLEALRRGAPLVAPGRAVRFLRSLSRLPGAARLRLLTAGGLMGLDEAREAGFPGGVEAVYRPGGWPTTAADTVRAVSTCVERGAEMVVFVGGDGTARDVYRALVESGAAGTPMLGVPSGVKVYSSVFARSPEAAARILGDAIAGRAQPCSGEILDIDEEAYRRGRLTVRLYGVATTLCHPFMVGSSKQPSSETVSEEENRRAIARYFAERYYRRCTLYVMGPGTTVKSLYRELGVRPSNPLGVDVIHDNRLVAMDVDEETLYRLVTGHRRQGGRVAIVLTPIGGQGFLLGRGNQQISPRVVKAAGGPDAILVVATRSKMAGLRSLYVDTGDPELDRRLAGYRRVLVDYGEEIIVKVLPAAP